MVALGRGEGSEEPRGGKGASQQHRVRKEVDRMFFSEILVAFWVLVLTLGRAGW